MTLDYTVDPVTSSDLPALTNLVHSAKLALSINRLIFLNWPNEKLQVTLYSRAVQGGYDDPVKECFKAVDNETQEVIGYIVLERKMPQDSQEAEKTDRSVPDGLNPPLLADVENATRQIAKEVNDMHHFDVIYICAKPAFQGRGIGSQLVQLGFDRAKAEGIPLSVCAEAPSIPFFKKIGFKETKHVDVDLQKYAPAHSGFGDFRLAGMIWHP